MYSQPFLYFICLVCTFKYYDDDVLMLEVADNLSCDSLFDCSCKELNHLQVIIILMLM